MRSALMAIVALAIVAIASTGSGEELPSAERVKIEKLIAHVQGLQGAVFIRNGVEYDAETAAKFLKGKWEANASQIKSATEFIDKVASKSSTSGKPYQIRLSGEKERSSREYLLEQLKKLAE